MCREERVFHEVSVVRPVLVPVFIWSAVCRSLLGAGDGDGRPDVG
jgi:hypothetical protein